MNEKTPLIRLAKKKGMSKSKMLIIRLLSVVVALVIGGIVFLALGHNPFSAYAIMIKSSLGKTSAIKQVIKYAVPLLGTALALAPCFRMKYWNIGGEGQITMGAVGATYFALFWVNKLPRPVLLIACCLAAMICGALWSLIPGVFRARWGTNETLFTLMMNYIAIGIVRWLQGGPWEGKPGSQIIPHFAAKAVLPKVWGIHCGWILMLIVTVLMYIYMSKTKQGFEIAVLGESVNTARYAGMNVEKVTIRTAALSGAICGFVGYLVACGANGSLNADVAAGAGFTAITVCWLAQLNPFAMILISLMLSVLSKGASMIQTEMGVPTSISDIITGIILLCMLGCEFFINYKMIFRGHHEKEAK